MLDWHTRGGLEAIVRLLCSNAAVARLREAKHVALGGLFGEPAVCPDYGFDDADPVAHLWTAMRVARAFVTRCSPSLVAIGLPWVPTPLGRSGDVYHKPAARFGGLGRWPFAANVTTLHLLAYECYDYRIFEDLVTLPRLTRLRVYAGSDDCDCEGACVAPWDDPKTYPYNRLNSSEYASEDPDDEGDWDHPCARVARRRDWGSRHGEVAVAAEPIKVRELEVVTSPECDDACRMSPTWTLLQVIDRARLSKLTLINAPSRNIDAVIERVPSLVDLVLLASGHYDAVRCLVSLRFDSPGLASLERLERLVIAVDISGGGSGAQGLWSLAPRGGVSVFDIRFPGSEVPTATVDRIAANRAEASAVVWVDRSGLLERKDGLVSWMPE
ncbi:hypothetical protein JCM3770_005529 [Rhodotorula araucariae]